MFPRLPHPPCPNLRGQLLEFDLQETQSLALTMSDLGHLSLPFSGPQYPHKIHRGGDLSPAPQSGSGWDGGNTWWMTEALPPHSTPDAPAHPTSRPAPAGDLPPSWRVSLPEGLSGPSRPGVPLPSPPRPCTCAAGPAVLAGPRIGRAGGGGRSGTASGAAPWAAGPQPQEAGAVQGAGDGAGWQQQQLPEQQKQSRQMSQHRGLGAAARVRRGSSLPRWLGQSWTRAPLPGGQFKGPAAVGPAPQPSVPPLGRRPRPANPSGAARRLLSAFPRLAWNVWGLSAGGAVPDSGPPPPPLPPLPCAGPVSSGWSRPGASRPGSASLQTSASLYTRGLVDPTRLARAPGSRFRRPELCRPAPFRFACLKVSPPSSHHIPFPYQVTQVFLWALCKKN